MRIILVTSEFPPAPGGIGKHAYCVAKSLQRKGHLVKVICHQYDAEKREIDSFNADLKDSGVEVFSFYNESRLKSIPEKFRFIRRSKPDLILLSGKSSFPAVWFRPFSKIHKKLFIHGSELKYTGLLNRLLQRSALWLCKEILPVSQFSMDLLPDKIKHKSRVVPNGLCLDDLRPLPNNSKKNLTYLQLLTVGSITKRKGQHRVISALPELLKSQPNLRYVVTGNPIKKDDLLDQVAGMGLNSNVVITGTVTDRELRRIYSESDIFIMLSENQPSGDVEGFGIAILEANFFGIPAIGALGCGIEDAISPGVNGELVDGNNASDVGSAMDKILSSYENYRKGAQEWALQHNWDNIIDRVIANGKTE